MSTVALSALCESVHDEASFLRFVTALESDRRAVDDEPTTIDGFREGWANQSIADFLEAGVAWAKDSGFGERPGPKSANPWRLFAQFMMAGRGYE